jgi:hypothetical protein
MTDQLPASGTPRPADLAGTLPRRATRYPAAVAAMVLATVAACSTAASQPPAASPSGGPGASPTAGPTASPVGLQHPTGANEIVLRIEESGGFVPVEWMATSAPSFTLYGDGTVVFRNPADVPPEPIGNVMRSIPFRTVKLDEAAVQALLEDALGRGGLGNALGPYHGMGADIPTTTFTIVIGGQTKKVDVTGLSPDMHPQSAAIVTALQGLAERLYGFAGAVNEQPYVPAGYRGVLIPVEQPFGPVVDWPWDDIDPDEFTNGENEFFRTRVMTPAEVAELGVAGAEGGIQGFALRSGDELFTFALRPLLPDEES